MEKWLHKYGVFLNYSALEIELGIGGGTLTEAHLKEIGVPEKHRSKIEAFIEEMHQDLVEQNK